MVKETLTSSGIYSPSLKQPVLFGTICGFAICVAIVCLCQHVPTACERSTKQGTGRRDGLSPPSAAYNSLWTGEGVGGSHCCHPPSVAMRLLFGDYWSSHSVRSYLLALTLAEEPTSCLVMEKCCTKITQRSCTTHKCCYSKVGISDFFLFQFGTILQIKQLFCTWFVSKKTFARE